MDALKEKEFICKLFSLYKPLLTDKQRTYFENHFIYDLSLQEIAENFHVSRAAVSESILFTKKALISLEENLGVVSLIGEIEKTLLENESDSKKIEVIRRIIDGI